MNRGLLASSFLVNFLLLNLCLSVVAFGLCLALEHLWPSVSPRSRSSRLLYALGLPPLLAWVILVASLIPPFFILEGHGLHLHFGISHPYHHLCFFDSPIGLPRSLLFRGLLLSSLFLILFSTFRGVHARWQIGEHLRWLICHRTILPEEEGLSPAVREVLQEFRESEGFSFHLIKASLPISLLSGIIHPRIILSTGLLRVLSPRQIRALLQHEVAHRLRLDNLSQFILSFCKNLLFISPTGHFLFRWWKQEVELLCDEMAIYQTQRPLDLAEALLQVQKALIGNRSFRLPSSILQSAFLHPGPSAFFERRIRNILGFCDRDLMQAKPRAAQYGLGSLQGLLVFGTLALFFLFLLNLWIDPLFLHLKLEKIVRFLT